MFRPYGLELFFYFVILEDPFNLLDLESLTNHTHYLYFLFISSYVPSASNIRNAAVYKSSLVRGIGIYVNEDTTGLKNFHRVIFDSGAIIFISTWRSDFISSITPFPDIYFGVMSNGMIIECKENFECHFLS